MSASNAGPELDATVRTAGEIGCFIRSRRMSVSHIATSWSVTFSDPRDDSAMTFTGMPVCWPCTGEKACLCPVTKFGLELSARSLGEVEALHEGLREEVGVAAFSCRNLAENETKELL